MKTPCTDGVCLVAEARGEHLRCQGACAYTPTPTDTPRTDAQRERDRTLVSAAMRLREWEELCDKLERELSAMLAVARQNGDDLDEARSELSALRAANELPCCDAKNDVTPGGCYRAVHAENELARLRASTAGMPEGPHEINYADRRGYAGKQPWVWLDDWRRATQRAERAEADLVKARDAVRAIYFAGYWHCDRPVDEVALWTALRDSSGISPGQTGMLLGPDRTENVAEECAQIAENYGDVRVAAAIRAMRGKP